MQGTVHGPIPCTAGSRGTTAQGQAVKQRILSEGPRGHIPSDHMRYATTLQNGNTPLSKQNIKRYRRL